jgi:hypothetical protein
MTLSQAGTALSGQYLYHSCDCIVRGKIAGDVEGNLAKVRWTEESPCRGGWRAGGKGYLFYRHAPQSDRPARLFGTRQYVGGTEHPGDGLSRQTLGEVTWTAVVVAASDVASRGPATCP